MLPMMSLHNDLPLVSIHNMFRGLFYTTSSLTKISFHTPATLQMQSSHIYSLNKWVPTSNSCNLSFSVLVSIAATASIDSTQF